MGSSPKDDNTPAPAPQGPPIDQVNPAQPPPKYAEFLPTQANAPPPTGLTQDMLNQIAQSAAPPPLSAATAPGAAGAPSSGDAERQTLAALLTQLLQPKDPRIPRIAEGGNRAGYTTSGPGGTSGFGGKSSSASNTGGLY